MSKQILLFVLTMLVSCALFAGDAVWWEGESAKKNDFVKSDWLDKTIRKTKLSKMDWLSCFVKSDAADKKETYTAEYAINVPADSEYTFWAREFYRRNASPWKFRFDDGKWVEVTKEHPHIRGSIADLGRDRSVVWCKYGKFKLAAGPHKFEIQISEREKKGFQAGFDSFLLTDVPFQPDGWHKPKVISKYEYIGTFFWLEGESAESNFTNKGGQIPEKSQRLSKDKWLVCNAASGEDPGEGFTAKWRFSSQVSSSMNFWVREFRKKDESSFLYRINEGKWKQALPSKAAFDLVDLSEEAAVCWVNYKKMYVQEGENTIEFKIDGENKNGEIKLAVDCLMLSLEPYVPQGKLRPDTIVKPPAGWFVFRPHQDPLARKNPAVLDLSKLNESKTGTHGFLKVDEKGMVFEDGTRPHFWGVNVYNPIMMDDDSVVYFVRQLAKFGVNLIRINGSLCNLEKKKFGPVDQDLFDRLCFFLATCRKEGVYVALANYDPADYIIKPNDGYAGYSASEANKHPYALLYIDEKYRGVYKNWAKFLKQTNKYNKLKLYRDPTIAWFEIHSGKGILEDGLKKLPKVQKDKLERIYNKWLIKRYGDLPYTLRSWSTPKKYHPVIEEDGRKGARCFRLLPFDSFKHSVLTNDAKDHFNKRKMDQMRFIADFSNGVNKELIKFLRDDCRFKGVISVGNASTSAPFILNGLDAYMKSTGDIVAHNKFIKPFRPLDLNAILKPGSFVKSRSVLRNPFISPVVKPNYKGKANVTTEVSWMVPNNYRGEAVPFVAAYSSLHGYNPYLWYQADDNSWLSRLSRFAIQSPATMGMFPGYALMFRRGDVKEGQGIISQTLNFDDVCNLKGDGINLNGLAKQTRLRTITNSKNQINPFSFLVGKVECQISRKDQSFVLEKVKVDKYFDAKKSTVQSSTKQLDLNYKLGQLTINTPKAQAFIGFTRRNITKKLKNVTISMQNSYGNILVISLDNQPLANSKHILIQSFSRENNNGWKTEKVPKEHYSRLVNVGDSPLIVEDIAGSVTFQGKNSKGWEVWELDPNGYRLQELAPADDKTLAVDLPTNTLYVELKKK